MLNRVHVKTDTSWQQIYHRCFQAVAIEQSVEAIAQELRRCKFSILTGGMYVIIMLV